jgi:hypothetical protein
LAKRDDTAPGDLRDLLVMPRDALGQPPLGSLLAALAIRAIRLLAERDLGKRMARRDQIQAHLVETWGEEPADQRPGPGGPGRVRLGKEAPGHGR